MALARNILHRRLHSLQEPQNVAFIYHIIHSDPPHSHKILPSHHRLFASSSQSLAESDCTHALKSLHSIFQVPLNRESYLKNVNLMPKLKQGEAGGISEKTGDTKKKNKKKKPQKNLGKSKEPKVKFVEEEEVEQVVKEELHEKSNQVEAASSSEEIEQEKSEVRRVKYKKKQPKKKSKKVKFVEEEEEGDVVKEELQEKPEQAKAESLSEETEKKKSEVRRVEDKKKKPKKKLKEVKFIKEEEDEVVKAEQTKKHEPKRLFDLFSEGEKVKFIEEEKVEVKLKKVNFIEEEEEEVVEAEQTKKPEPKRLFDLFIGGEKSSKANRRRLSSDIAPVEKHKEVKQREPVGFKKLSLDMETFLLYLYKQGYFRGANFVKGKNFDLSWFDNPYARYYTLSAARKFGRDKQELSKWLSGSDLKQVAMFGCPSDSKSQVFYSKRLRRYFKIPENTVCSKCVLRDSCKFVNQNIWRTDGNNLNLAVAMNIICSYAMSIVHPQLVVPDKVNHSVNRLLKEVLKLSQTL